MSEQKDIDFSGITINNSNSEEMKNGRWVNYRNGVRLKIARNNNAEFTKKLIELRKTTNLSDEEILPIAMAGTLLRDWDSFEMPVENENGETERVEIPFTEKHAENLLKNDQITMEFVQSYAMNALNFVDKNVATLKKKRVNS